MALVFTIILGHVEKAEEELVDIIYTVSIKYTPSSDVVPLTSKGLSSLGRYKLEGPLMEIYR